MPPVDELALVAVVAELETVTGEVALVVVAALVVEEVVEPVLPPEPCVTRFVQPAASARRTHP